jgi:hypothetical protein
MEHTWASGAIELLAHADAHINLETAFDRRIAFISIDNSVETSIRTFLSLPTSKSGIKVPRKDVEAVENSFPGLLTLLWQHVGNRLTGIDETDIEHYHRIRNKLYHEGTGLSVDEQYLLAYRQIAVLLLKNLFGVSLKEPQSAPTLERLIVLWNQIEEAVNRKLKKAGIERHTFFWDEAIMARIFSVEDLQNLTELRMIRNREVHSSTLDRKKVEYAVDLAERLLLKLKQSTTPRLNQRFNVVVGIDQTSDNIWAPRRPVRFHHAQVWIESGTVHGCRAYLTEIKGEHKSWKGHEQLTFSPSEATDSLSKAIYAGVKYELDVLVITSDGEIHVCNHNRQWARLPRLHDLFSHRGFYDLMVSIAGEDAAAEAFSLRFQWTGNWQTSFLTNATRCS